MRVRLLGTAAGGGFPQWNCACRNCRAVRSGDRRTLPRTQTCVALSGDDRRWFLVGASPDIRSQIESFPPLGVDDRVRGTALEGILLTSADLDQVLGLFFRREGGPLCVHASGSVRRSLCEGLSLGAVLGRYCGLDWREPPTEMEPLRDGSGQPSGLLYEAFPVPGKPPRYREGCAPGDPGDCLGYRFTDLNTGGRLVLVPGSAALDDDLVEKLEGCDAVLFDGTFWSENEMQDSGVGGASASEMGHLPIGGPGGSLIRIAGLPARRKIYVHINNTNPVLLEGSPELRLVEAAGAEVGRDGMEFVL